MNVDICGEKIDIGDHVIFSRYNGDSDLYSGVVTKISPKTLWAKCDKSSWNSGASVSRSQCAFRLKKITKEEYEKVNR